MDLGIIIGALGVLVALAVGYATVLATRRYGSRKGQLVIDTRNVRLLPVTMQHGNPPVVETAPMNPPVQWSVQIRIRNTGRDDIGAESFSGKPLALTFGFGQRIVGFSTVNTATELLMDDRGYELRLEPRRIPTKTNWQYNVHVVPTNARSLRLEEEPFVLVHSPLHNTTVRIKTHETTVGSGMLVIGGGPPPFRGSGRNLKGRVSYY